MSVHYKFKSTLDFDTVSFDGLHISVSDLKKEIFHQKRIGKNTDFDLQITNAQTKEDYTDDNALIAKNTSLIVARVPLTLQQKRSWDRSDQQASTSSKDEDNLGHAVDLTRLDGSEDDKIRAMMTQSTQDYDPSNYMKIRGANQTGDLPPHYLCHKCHQPGHWIKNCPLGMTQEPIEIKKSTGIPRSFMVPVEGPLVPGAMITPTGHYAVPAIDHQAYKEGKKERPPFFQDPEPAVEKPEIPEDLLCNICKDLLTDAVMIPCCGNSFCDECIRTFLLESEEHECPVCNEKDVSPETLIPNRFLRNAVMTFKNETGYAKRKTYQIPPKSTQIEKEKSESQQSTSQSEPKESSQDLTTNPPESLPSSQQPSNLTVDPEVTESTSEVEIPSETQTEPAADEETDVIPPPPPGTEPLLPIPSVSKVSEHQDADFSDISTHDKKINDDKCAEEDRRFRERRRSFSKEIHRERSGDSVRRIENFRPMSRRRSLSPRQSHCNEYPTHSTTLPQLTNPVKTYPNIPPNNGPRYAPSMHYDSGIRRPSQERPDTPTVDEPHLHSQTSVAQTNLLPYPPGEERIPPPAAPNYNQPPPNITPHTVPLLPDPYMPHRMPMYPHQQGPHYGPPRYDRLQYQQTGFRPTQTPRNYNGPPRPLRGMHHMGYRGVQPPPPGLSRTAHNGNPTGVIDDPLEAFERMLREKDERDRRLGKHRRRSPSRTRSRSYSRSRSRSFGRRSPLPSRISRSRSPPLKRRSSRSPLPLRQRSRSPKRRSRSGSFSISSRSRSYSRSQSPRVSVSRDRDRNRDRDRDRERDRSRDLPSRYRSPVRSPPRFQRDRNRERARSREPRKGYNSYYNDSPADDYGFRDRERDLPPNRERSSSRYQSRNQSSQHNIPPLLPHPPPLMSLGAPPPERKDYYDSYNRYSGQSSQRYKSPVRDSYHKRFDDVAPPGTEGYYDIAPPGVDYPDRSTRDDRQRSRMSKERDDRDHTKDSDVDNRDRLPLRDDRIRERDERPRERDDRRGLDRDREKDDRDRVPIIREREERIRETDDRDRRDKDKERDERYNRDHREDERQSDKRDYEKERYRDDRDRYRVEDKCRLRDRERKERDYEVEKDRERQDRHESRHSADRKKSRKSCSPHPPKIRNELKDISPERMKKKDKDHDDKPDEKKKEKKIKEKKKKKDSEEKEKKKKKKKEKKLIHKEITKIDIVKQCELQKLEVNTKSETAQDDIPMETEFVVQSSNNEPIESADNTTVSTFKTEFDDKSLIMNPEPPELSEQEFPRQAVDECSANPPNPNFKPIPELKTESKTIDSLYGGLDDTEINAVITEKYSLLPDINESEIKNEIIDNTGKSILVTDIEVNTCEKLPIAIQSESQSTENPPYCEEESTKKDEFLAPMPELSKWERDDTTEKMDETVVNASPTSELTSDDSKTTRVVTSEVLKRAENAIFQKAINAIRPIEIKKISESRKVLYQNPEPKILEPEINREVRKNVNVTINIGRNERNVEISEPSKKAKLDRTKFKSGLETHSPTRLSAKERLGEKVDDDQEKKVAPVKPFAEKRESNKNDSSNTSRSPKPIREKRISPLNERRIEASPIGSAERKVFLDDRKREKDKSDRVRDRGDNRSDKHDSRDERDIRGYGKSDFLRLGASETSDKEKDNDREKERERRIPSPPSQVTCKHHESIKLNILKRKKDDDDVDKKEFKKSRCDKKRKKEHRSRSKSKERKKRKEKKHKKDKDKSFEKKSKHKELVSVRDKSQATQDDINSQNNHSPQVEPTAKKPRKNPRLVSDRKRSGLDEASFEPDYSATDSDSDIEDTKFSSKKVKQEGEQLESARETEFKSVKRRIKSTSSDDDSSTSASSSTESDSSDDSHKKRKKKHKKHKKRKSARRDSSSDTDSDSDSTDSSSNEEKHKKKSKKSKSKSKQSKKKKKSKHK